jgi:thioredoxin-related protein
MAPMVHGLEASYFGKVDFFYFDADDSETLALQQEFGFQYQPYFVLLDHNGDVVKRWAGFVSKEDFEASFAEILK